MRLPLIGSGVVSLLLLTGPAVSVLAQSHPAEPARSRAVVTVFHVSDYHSHATPFYSEGEEGTAGLARAVGYLKRFARRGDTLVFSGGDTMNAGSPAFSDKHRCADWSVWNGILDAMAFGNHDADYGPREFASCRQTAAYPILSANTVGSDGSPLFSAGGKDYLVFKRSGVKIGVFALAGADFDRLVKPERRPVEGAGFTDPVATARRVVAELREREKVAAVILIGHSLWQDDRELARKVPGIDLILGTHSHRKEELTKIEGTSTWMISPFQYLTYVSRVELTFTGGKLSGVSGKLERMKNSIPQDAGVSRRVAEMQAALVSDPEFAPLLVPIGLADGELSTDGQFTGEGGLANLTLDVVRRAARVNAALSTASAFREPIPPGKVLHETLRAALPYPNKLLSYVLSGEKLEALLAHSVTEEGSDGFSQVSGVRFVIRNGKPGSIQVLSDPADESSFAPLARTGTYQVVLTDFQARVAMGYREILSGETPEETGLEMREELRRAFASGPLKEVRDGRIKR